MPRLNKGWVSSKRLLLIVSTCLQVHQVMFCVLSSRLRPPTAKLSNLAPNLSILLACPLWVCLIVPISLFVLSACVLIWLYFWDKSPVVAPNSRIDEVWDPTVCVRLAISWVLALLADCNAVISRIADVIRFRSVAMLLTAVCSVLLAVLSSFWAVASWLFSVLRLPLTEFTALSSVGILLMLGILLLKLLILLSIVGILLLTLLIALSSVGILLMLGILLLIPLMLLSSVPILPMGVRSDWSRWLWLIWPDSMSSTLSASADVVPLAQSVQSDVLPSLSTILAR